MSSSSRRSFYDPKQPRLLTEHEIAQLSPAECDAACLQVDQILVNILQNIDADFGKSHRIITDKILPDLERYGEASKGIWEGLKFWQGFFESSANVKLSGNNDESEAASTVVDQSHQSEDNSIETVQPDEQNDDYNSRADLTAPDSPFENLKEDLRQNLGIPPKSSAAPAAQQPDESQQTGSSGSLRRPPHWHDLSMDSPDVTLQMPVPKDLSMLIDGQSGVSLDSDISMSSYAADEPEPHEQETSKEADPSHSHTRKSTGRGSKILLHQALLRDTMSGNHKRQTISTPAKSRSRRGSTLASLPPEAAEPGWDGITDLRKVNLDGFAGSSKMASRPFRLSGEHAGDASQEQTEESLRAGISPPQTIHFSVPRSKLAQTPSKEAARLVTRDVLETARLRAGYANPTDLEDSPPLEPPSVLREWKQRGYESLFKPQADEEAQPSTSKSIASAAEGVSDAGPSRDMSVSRALIDLREGDTGSSRGSTRNSQRPDRDDPFNEPSTNKPRSGHSSNFAGPSSRGHQLRSMAMDDSMDSPPDSPTLFGIRRDSKLPLRTTQDSVPADPARPHNSRPAGSQTFVPMRPDEIDTFFGGNLLESECFEPSPLQGKRVRYTDPKDP
ncbi:DASH complex subunit ask1 [Puccinia graminis f. sp. tritici]|uniref:DASH complex subunit ASK1 n=1 Tax=Puccinia graminis f. sp. tritici TaxID=56615 RepID=A0A5B0PP21_PUCGR|nr:DASH complex subunit ask1 [Puccinia graminis f. sp. tritici]